jgi:Tfp pilus assembly protein PilF
MANPLTKFRQEIICLTFFLFFQAGFAQTRDATAREYEKTFTTYPYSDPNPVPVTSSLYPYFRYDGFTDKPVEKGWKVVELENDYIKVMILPEIGGKIWTAIEKSTNQPFIYYNHAVKFRDIAMRGPYTSGGLELNYGIIGHTPNCATPVDYIVRKNDDGSVSCILGVLDLLTRSNWRLEVRLPKDKAYFITKTFWYNSTPINQPYYHWLNGGYKAEGNLEFIYPGTRYIGHGGEYASWPVNETNGKNISFYNCNDFGGYKSYHVFGKYTDFFGGYWHDDDFGMARYGSHDDKAGKKIWIWGLSGQGMIWENLLTDTDGQYVEMQSGRLFNQNSLSATHTPFKHLGFAPYSTDIWTEYFFPVLKTKGFVEANDYGALNVVNGNGYLRLYFSPVQTLDDVLEVFEGEKVIYKKNVHFTPLNTFCDSVKFSGEGNKLVVRLGTNLLVYHSDPSYNVLGRPVESPSDFDWKSAYGLYVEGKEAMDQKMYPLAESRLRASLDADHNFLPAIIRMAELKYRNMRYPEALDLIRKALSIDTHDGEINYYYGLINEANGNIVDARDGFDIATMSSEFRSPAYTELSRIYLKEKNLEKALNYATRAVDYNRFNIDALQLQSVICRFQKNREKEDETLNMILSYDPLNHFARFEKYLLSENEKTKLNFTSLIRNELPHETFMELAIWYFNSGCREDAEKVLSLTPATVEKEYWISYLTNRKVDLKGIDPDFSFPFRSETALILEQLLKCQDDWLMKYHLALIYRDRNRMEESTGLFLSCADQPVYAPFYAARAEILKDKDDTMCEADLKKALALDNQWRYHQLLANFYDNHQQYDKALAVTGPYYKSHPDDFIIGSLHAQNLLYNRKYREADALLKKINILPHEGATNGREMYREVKLMQAAQSMGKKKFNEALGFIKESRLWPENLGVGKPYDEDIDTRLEDWMAYLCYNKLNKTGEANHMLERIIGFQPLIDNTVRNFTPSNTLVTAWALEKLNRENDAKVFIEDQGKMFPEYGEITWSRAVFENDRNYILPVKEKDANIRVIEQLMASGI